MDRDLSRKFIDWKRTGKKLEILRTRNETFIKAVCYLIRGKDGVHCNGKCETCEDMDNHISRVELASVFGVTEHVVLNWEKGDTPLPIEELLFYSKLSDKKIDEILQYM